MGRKNKGKINIYIIIFWEIPPDNSELSSFLRGRQYFFNSRGDLNLQFFPHGRQKGSVFS